MRLGLIADPHYRGAVPGTSSIVRRRCREALELVRRAVDLFRDLGVEAVLCVGDLVDDGLHPEALADVVAVDRALGESGAPRWVIPGNHDPAPTLFFKAIPRPPADAVVGNCRLLTFADDYAQPGEQQAERQPDEMARMARALVDVAAPGVFRTISIQHYLIWPQRASGYRHGYSNVELIRASLEGSPQRILAISGHYHGGAICCGHGGIDYVVGAALCEAPHPCYIIDVDDGGIGIRVYNLAGDGSSWEET